MVGRELECERGVKRVIVSNWIFRPWALEVEDIVRIMSMTWRLGGELTAVHGSGSIVASCVWTAAAGKIKRGP